MKSTKVKIKKTTEAKKKLLKKKGPLVVVDEAKGLIFANEEELMAYFEADIAQFETEYNQWRSSTDFLDTEQVQFDDCIDLVLNDPDEVWCSTHIVSDDQPVFNYIRNFEDQRGAFQYIVVAYVNSEQDQPVFVFIHFPTRDPNLVKKYQNKELVYNRDFERASLGAIEGDAITEADPLAIGLYLTMLRLRSEKDISEEQFQGYSRLREDTIQNPDEIWRKNDLSGNVLVTFIKEFPEDNLSDLHYLCVTQEDPQSNVHALLFSFPSADPHLIDRYRQGENLQADEVTQESSH